MARIDKDSQVMGRKVAKSRRRKQHTTVQIPRTLFARLKRIAKQEPSESVSALTRRVLHHYANEEERCGDI